MITGLQILSGVTTVETTRLFETLDLPDNTQFQLKHIIPMITQISDAKPSNDDQPIPSLLNKKVAGPWEDELSYCLDKTKSTSKYFMSPLVYIAKDAENNISSQDELKKVLSSKRIKISNNINQIPRNVVGYLAFKDKQTNHTFVYAFVQEKYSQGNNSKEKGKIILLNPYEDNPSVAEGKYIMYRDASLSQHSFSGDFWGILLIIPAADPGKEDDSFKDIPGNYYQIENGFVSQEPGTWIRPEDYSFRLISAGWQALNPPQNADAILDLTIPEQGTFIDNKYNSLEIE